MRLVFLFILIVIVAVGIASRLDTLRRNAQWEKVGDFFNRALAQEEKTPAEKTAAPKRTQSVFFNRSEGAKQRPVPLEEILATDVSDEELGKANLLSLRIKIRQNDDLLKTLEKQTQRLNERETLLEARTTVLAALEKKVQEREKVLLETKEEIQALLQRYDDEQEGGLKQLIGIYSTIEPKRAAEIFNDLDTSIVVSLMRRMPTRRVAPILAAMQPDKARRITLLLSE